ncbi:MAG: hypothetical protein MJZ57_00735 [Bacteroidales bacterium]|nr:hypothetical protein [Bacteroidales bacterium]
MKTLQIIKKEYQRVGYDESDIEPVEYTEVKATYNEAGQIVREARFDSDGNLNTLTINHYDENHLLVQSEQFDQENILLQKSINVYNDKQQLVSQSNFFGDESNEYVTKYIYDEDGNLLRHEMFFDDELDYVEKIMEYEDGKMVKETENDDYGNTLYVNTYSYNEKGLLSKHVRDEIQNKDRRTREYFYDDNGNCVKELIYDYSDALIAKIYRTYNDDNLLIETEEEDLDNYRKITLEYEGKLCIKNTVFTKEGQIRGWAEYSYDETEKEVAAREFIPDEIQPENFRMLRETRYERA